MRKLILLVMLLVVVVNANAQQDAQFSQYMFNSVYINPAYAGYQENWNINTFFRKQWSNFPGAPQTLSFALDGIANDGKVGLGLQVVNDKIGITNSTTVYASYAYRIHFNDDNNKVLAFGLSGGIIQNNLDLSRLSPQQANDPTLAALTPSVLLPDARFGVFYNSDRFFIGASADQLISAFWRNRNAAQRDYLNDNLHWYLTAGGLVHLSDNLDYKPSFLVKDDIKGPTSLDLNNMLLIDKRLWLGLTYRTAVPLYNKPNLQPGLSKTADIVAMLAISLGEKLKLGYAYDYSLNKVTQQYSTHELSLTYFFLPVNRRMLSPRYF